MTTASTHEASSSSPRIVVGRWRSFYAEGVPHRSPGSRYVRAPWVAGPPQAPTLKGLYKHAGAKRPAEILMAERCHSSADGLGPFFCHQSFCPLPSPCLPVFFRAAQIEAEIPVPYVVGTRVIAADAAHFEQVRIFAAEVRTMMPGLQTPGHGCGLCQGSRQTGCFGADVQVVRLAEQIRVSVARERIPSPRRRWQDRQLGWCGVLARTYGGWNRRLLRPTCR